MAHEHHHGHDHCEECGHEHHSELKGPVIRIVLAAVFLAAAVAVEKFTQLTVLQLLPVYLVPYLIAGADTIKEAVEGLMHGDALDENFLMTIATLGALAIGFLPGGEAQYPEAVFVMLFFQIGELFEAVAEGRSRKAVAHLTEIRPESANLAEGKGFRTVPAASLKAGDIILIRPGEKVPSDGIVLEGASGMDTLAITGESIPRDVAPGDTVLSGFVNGAGALTVKVTAPYENSTAAKILRLVEDSATRKSSREKFITRFAKVYTPIVVLLAVVLAIVPTLLGGEFTRWLYNALTFLIVSCPCALVISVPLAFFGGIGAASRKGILVKGSNYLELLSKPDTMVFDKTGTLTKGVFTVTAVHPEALPERELLHLAAHVERYSTHPIAASLLAAYPEEADDCKVSSHEAIPGKGTMAIVNGRKVAVGNQALMEEVGAAWHHCSHDEGTIIHVAVDGEYMGHILISDTIKEEAPSAIASLKGLGLRRAVMLTGDAADVADSVAQKTKMDEVYSGLLPQDKVEKLEGIMAAAEGPVAFVGDGMNDAPVLSRADVGIAMGAIGSSAAIEAADVVIMNDDLSSLPAAVKISRKTISIASGNIAFAIGIKVLVLGLAAFGLATMWMAVFADVGVTVLAVLNSMRTLRAGR